MSELSPFAPPPTQMSPRQKAAIVIHLLISGGVDPGLRDLSPDQQRALVDEMQRLRFVDRATLASVVAEFASELDGIGLHFPSDPARLLAALDGQLSLEVLEGLQAELGPDAIPGDGVWTRVGELDNDAMVALVEGETDEVCAILLSKLPPGRAAALMADLPQERADSIAEAFARTEGVTPGAVSAIGTALVRAFDVRPKPGLGGDPVDRVAGILNMATSGLRRQVLDTLDDKSPDFAARVRAAVFSFENIADRVAPRDVPKVLRAVDNSVLVTALKGAPDEQAHVGEFMLAAISSRLADQIRDEINERADVPADEAETAMGEIVVAIRDLEESGELALIMPED